MVRPKKITPHKYVTGNSVAHPSEPKIGILPLFCSFESISDRRTKEPIFCICYEKRQQVLDYIINRYGQEKKTRDRLTAMGIECFLPIQEEIHQWSDRRKKVERVVIPMMIFVRVSDEERGLPLTLSAISRYMVLRGESVPAVIPDRQMEKFKFMLDYSEEAVELCTTPLAVGEQVRVIKGPLAGLEGELVTVDGKSKVVVRLDMLGCAQVDMSAGFVEKIQI